jgi:hypothetical protein
MDKAVTLAVRAPALLGALLSIAIAWPAAAQEIRVTGVLVSGPASMAIVSGPDGRDKVVRIGQEINSGATLDEVSANGVVVLRNQRREWLPLVGGSAAPPLQFSGGPQPKLAIPGAASQSSDAMEPRRAKAEISNQMGAAEAAR